MPRKAWISSTRDRIFFCCNFIFTSSLFWSSNNLVGTVPSAMEVGVLKSILFFERFFLTASVMQLTAPFSFGAEFAFLPPIFFSFSSFFKKSCLELSSLIFDSSSVFVSVNVARRPLRCILFLFRSPIDRSCLRRLSAISVSSLSCGTLSEILSKRSKSTRLPNLRRWSCSHFCFLDSIADSLEIPCFCSFDLSFCKSLKAADASMISCLSSWILPRSAVNLLDEIVTHSSKRADDFRVLFVITISFFSSKVSDAEFSAFSF
mmetsp:Transcript_18089/g.41139  ORF Transcript_18089/g.41139 Transcript_18089/m.41139 type:complete len:262 (+) Transcript_18089:823-1608(+)